MQVKDIMSSPCEKIDFNATITQVAQKMKSSDVGILPVEKGDEIVGVITDRDIVLKVLAEKLDPNTTAVNRVMSSDVTTCYEDDDIRDAAKLMEDRQIRRLVVLDRNDSLTGILSVADFAVKGKDEHLSYEVLEKVCEPAHSGW
jgi:CBS domain-containing protein